MGFLVEAITDIAPYIYAACGLVALFQLYRTWQVRAERRQAVFSLERDKAIDDLYRIFLSALLILVVMGFTYFASTTLRAAMITVESSSVFGAAGRLLDIPQWTSVGADPDPDIHAGSADGNAKADPYCRFHACAG